MEENSHREYDYKVYHEECKGIDDLTGFQYAQCCKYLQLATASAEFIKVLEDDQRSKRPIFEEFSNLHNDAQIIKILTNSENTWATVVDGSLLEAYVVRPMMC